MSGHRWIALALVATLAGGAGCSRRASTAQIAGWNAEIQSLEATQDSLRARGTELVAADPRIQKLPKADVVVSIPTSFLRNVIERVFGDVAGRATLSLGGIKAHVAKSVKKIVTIGSFVVDVDINHVTARLEPGQPTITFGDNVTAMSLPVALKEGQGEAKIHFLWDGKNIADMTCGDMDITETLTAEVVPARYVVSGRLLLTGQDSDVVCRPVFPPTILNIKVRPTKASWAKIDKILAEKHGVCGWVLDKVDVRSILAGLVETKGFNVRLPIDKLRPFALPNGLSDTLTVAGHKLSVASKRTSLQLDQDAIWYGANVTLKPE